MNQNENRNLLLTIHRTAKQAKFYTFKEQTLLTFLKANIILTLIPLLLQISFNKYYFICY
jgi:hypothetical protein